MQFRFNSLTRISFSLLLAFAITNLGGVPGAYAQTTATISGAVTDGSGAVVPGASVVATHVATGASRSTVADASGRYRLPGLQVGEYKLDASYQGFKTVTRSGITLVVGQEAVVDIPLQVGAVSEIVEVTGEAPLLETTTAVLGSVVEQKQILELPLNGRSFTELATLQAGAVVSQTGGISVSQGYGSKISISGGRFTSNLFMLDGTVLNDSYNSAGSAAGGVVSGVEAIREFKVITNAYSAEYGQHTGGVVNAISKSGTNSFHGSVYDFLRNDNLDAPRWEDNAFNGGEKPEFRRNQFGAAIGGPIAHDRTFFFTNYEGLRSNLGNIAVVGVPDAQARAGILNGQNYAGTAGFAVVRPLIDKLWPLPPGTGTPKGAGIVEFTRVEEQPSEQNYLTGRVDHKLSDNDSIFGRYTIDRGSTQPYASMNSVFDQTTRNQFVTAQYDRVISPTLLNSVNVGYTRTRTASLGLIAPGFERVSFTDSSLGIGVVTVAGGIRSTGSGNTDPRTFILNNFQVRDDVSWSHGRHAMKTGFSFSRLQHNDNSPRQPSGQFDFPSMSALLRNEPNNALITFNEDASRYIRQNVIGAYFQDDMQLGSTLALNIGVRWEPFTLSREKTGKGHIALEDKFYELNANGTNRYGPSDIVVQNSNFTNNPSLNSFAPRVGIAWTPGNGRTTLRAGAGFFFEPLVYWTYRITTLTTAPLAIENRFQDTDSTNATTPALGGGVALIDFPNAYFTQRAAIQGSLAEPRYESIDPTPNHPYSMKFSFDLQRQITNSFLVRVGYSGTHGVHQGIVYENNGRRPDAVSLSTDGTPTFVGANPNQNTRFGRSRHREFFGNQFYNSMRLEAEQRVTRGLQFRAAYTWAKNIDDGTSITGSTDFDSDGAARYWTIRERGPSALDTRHSFTFNSVYELPGKGMGGAAGAALSGWSLSGLMRLSSGQPITPVIGFDRSRTVVGTRYPNLAPGADNNPTHGTSIGCEAIPAGTKLGTPDHWFDPCAFQMPPNGFLGNLGRNTVSGPGIFTVDLGLSKNFKLGFLGEQGGLNFRGEFFNVLNHPNFDTPGLSLFNSVNANTNTPSYLTTAGRVTGTATSARQVQLALKLVF
jgi:hypothetical protein